MHGVNYKRERENEKRGEIGMVKQEEERKRVLREGQKERFHGIERYIWSYKQEKNTSEVAKQREKERQRARPGSWELPQTRTSV